MPVERKPRKDKGTKRELTELIDKVADLLKEMRSYDQRDRLTKDKGSK